VVPSASTIKVLISVALWEAAAAGVLDAHAPHPVAGIPRGDAEGLLAGWDGGSTATLADLDLLMLAVSDNDATNAVIDAVGMPRINAVSARLGLGATALRRHMLDFDAAAAGNDNTTSAADLARLMAALGTATDIAPQVAGRVLGALRRSQHRDVAPRYLWPAPISVACKSGELDHVRHDAALVEFAERSVAVAVVSTPAAAPDGLARVAAAAVRAVR
jgi:beta-lactamase class A